MKRPQAEDGFETDHRFPSGEWEGFYIYGFGPNARHLISCVLEFKEGDVRGSGVDDIHRFVWEGSYCLEKGRCNLTKFYPSHEVYYEGYAEENGIWGTWELPGFPPSKGGFHLWPKGMYEELAKEESEEVPEYVEEEFRSLEPILVALPEQETKIWTPERLWTGTTGWSSNRQV